MSFSENFIATRLRNLLIFFKVSTCSTCLMFLANRVTFEAYGDILTKPVSEITYKHYDVVCVSVYTDLVRLIDL